MKERFGNKKIRPLAIFTIITIFLVAFNINSLAIDARLRTYGLETYAMVTELRREITSAGSIIPRTRVFVAFRVDDRILLDRQLNIHANDTHVGERIPIYFNVNNTWQITPVDASRSTNTIGRSILFAFAWLVYVGVYFVGYDNENTEESRKQQPIRQKQKKRS